MEITLDSRVVGSDEPLSAASGEALLMFSVEKGAYYGLNEMAAVIWQRLKSPVTVAALCADLQQAFDVSSQVCEADVLVFLRKLEAKGLLHVVS